MKLLIRKEANLKDLGNSQPMYIEGNEKACSGENPKVWPCDHLTKAKGS